MESGQPIEKKSKTSRALSWIGENTARTVLGIAVTAAVTAGVVWMTGKGKDEGQRLDQVRQEIADSGLEIRDFRKVSLHPGATTSYLFALQQQGKFEPEEIRIYDAEGESLQQRFSFKPKIQSADPDVVVAPESFEVLEGRDVTQDGQPELIGSYELEAANAVLQIPVVIAWDSSEREYLLRPLLKEDPRARTGDAVAAGGALEPFASPYVVTTEEGERYKTWAAEAIELVEWESVDGRGKLLYLGGAWPVPSHAYAQAVEGKKLQIAYWLVGGVNPVPTTSRLCWQEGFTDDTRLLDEKVGKGESEQEVIARGWAGLARADERSRRGEIDPERGTFIGGAEPGGGCLLSAT